MKTMYSFFMKLIYENDDITKGGIREMKAYRAFLVVMLLAVLGILVYSQKSERIDHRKNNQITDTDAQSGLAAVWSGMES